MLDLVGNPEDRFSHNEAHMYMYQYCIKAYIFLIVITYMTKLNKNAYSKSKRLKVCAGSISIKCQIDRPKAFIKLKMKLFQLMRIFHSNKQDTS